MKLAGLFSSICRRNWGHEDVEFLDTWYCFILLQLLPEHSRFAFYIFIFLTHLFVFPDFDSSRCFPQQPWREIAAVRVGCWEQNGPSWVAICSLLQLWKHQVSFGITPGVHFVFPPASRCHLQKWGFCPYRFFYNCQIINVAFQLDKTSQNSVFHGILSWITKGYSKLLQEKEMEIIAQLLLHQILMLTLQ